MSEFIVFMIYIFIVFIIFYIGAQYIHYHYDYCGFGCSISFTDFIYYYQRTVSKEQHIKNIQNFFCFVPISDEPIISLYNNYIKIHGDYTELDTFLSYLKYKRWLNKEIKKSKKIYSKNKSSAIIDRLENDISNMEHGEYYEINKRST